MIKRIVEFFKRLYIKLFCDVELENRTADGLKAQYTLVDELHEYKPVQQLQVVNRRSGKTITATRLCIWQYLKNGYPRVYHLSKYARKRKVRKKNVHRISKVLWEIMND